MDPCEEKRPGSGLEKRKLKVAQFIGAIQDGGAETLVKDYALLLDKSRFDVIIITRWKGLGTANYEVLKNAGVRMLTIYPSNSVGFKIFNRLFGSIYIPFRLLAILREERVDILHGHLGLLHNIVPISAKIRNIRLFYTCHNLPKYIFRGIRRAEAKRLIRTNGLRMIALHDEMREELDRLFGVNDTVVIRNGVDFARFQNITESQPQIRASLGIPEGAYVIGHVGRFGDQKNQDFLVDVFREVAAVRDDAFLLLVGSGSTRADIEAKIGRLGLAERVLILSHRSDVPRLMKAMDIFVFPSRFEGLGIVLIEAQVSGLRCVASDAVPAEAFQTELAVPVSLREPAAKWRDVILDAAVKGTRRGDLALYDMNREIRRLEQLYLGEI